MFGIMVELILWSNDPELSMQEIGQSINMFITELEMIGDTKTYGQFKDFARVIDVSSLMYSTKFIATYDVEEAIEAMIDMVEPRLDLLAKIVEKYSLKVKFCIVVKLDRQPIILIPSKFIRIMSLLSAYLEFDTYLDEGKKSIG